MHPVCESNGKFQYDEAQKLGSGYSANVFACFRKDVPSSDSPLIEHYAVKVIHNTIDEDRCKVVELEATLLKRINHPNIIKFYGQYWAKNKLQAYLVMEQVSRGKSLDKFIQSRANGMLNFTQTRLLTC